MLAPKGLKEQYPERYEKLVNAFHTAWTDPDFIAMLSETEEDKIYNVMSPEDSTVFLQNLLQLVEDNKAVLLGEE